MQGSCVGKDKTVKMAFDGVIIVALRMLSQEATKENGRNYPAVALVTEKWVSSKI